MTSLTFAPRLVGWASASARMLVVALFLTQIGAQSVQPQREQVGEVLGKPVYRDELKVGEHAQPSSELRRLFVMPLMKRYLEDHKADVAPTERELDAATAYFDNQHREQLRKDEPRLREQLAELEKRLAAPAVPPDERRKLETDKRVLQVQLTPPGRTFADFVVRNWKVQRYLYSQFGGGRVLWQQSGLEAFDAMHAWLKAQEVDGSFKITDPELRSALYEYWTTMKHGAFMIDDKERIRAEFLEPQWLPPAVPPGPKTQ